MKVFKKLATLTLVMCMVSPALAALTTLSGVYWPPTGSSGLDQVQFNVQSAAAPGSTASAPGTVQVALGAHPYKNGATMPNNGIDTFYANTGFYGAEDRANWSFDFSIDARSCQSCAARLMVDIDPSSSQTWKSFGLWPVGGALVADSQNLEMNWVELLFGNDFDPNAVGEYNLRLGLVDLSNPDGATVAETAINVVVSNRVPEPTSLAIALVGLAGLAGVNGRKRQTS